MTGERVHLAKWLDTLRSSYWFLPGLLVVVGAALAAAAVAADRLGAVPPDSLPAWLRVRDPGAARGVLTTIAGAMITIVSLTFSISIVALTLASSQFGSRLLYNFMRDRGNQAVLGFLLGTFVYCLVVLSAMTVGAGETLHQLAFGGALALALAAVGALVYYLHHVAESIQATNVITNVGRELRAIIDRSLPELGERELGADSDLPGESEQGEPALAVASARAGTVQAIDGPALVALAAEADVVVEVLPRPGDYVLDGADVLRVHGAPSLGGELEEGLRAAVVVGGRRTLVQDLEFAFHQLVEIAVRALSPGVNDPFTCMSCIDELGTALARVARRGPPPSRLTDEAGRVRVHLDATDFAGIVGAAFDQIRQHGKGDVAVSMHLLATLRRVAPLLRTDAQRASLLEQGRLAYELSSAHAETDPDRAGLRSRFEALERACAA